MSASKRRINHVSKLQLEHLKHLSDNIDAHRTRASSVAFRKEVLEKQNIRNYSSEYNRIRAHLEDSSVPFKTKDGLKTRAAHLKSLGAAAVDTIS